jgi:hypothetical protein
MLPDSFKESGTGSQQWASSWLKRRRAERERKARKSEIFSLFVLN